MESPKKYVPRFLLPPEERVISPEREINSIMGKMSPDNYNSLTNHAKKIMILDNPELIKPTKADVEKIKPIANKLVKNVMECNEDSHLIEIYGNFFYEMTMNPISLEYKPKEDEASKPDNRPKRQARVLMLTVNNEVSSFIGSYTENAENTIEDTLKLYSVVKFLGYLYHKKHKDIPAEYILMITDQFCSIKYINILGRVINYNLEELIKEEQFKAKSVSYRKVIEEYCNDKSKGPMYFMLKDALSKPW